MPRRVATRAVRSYRTFSPLPAKLAVYFLWHFPWVRTLQALPGALPDGARTFLRILKESGDCLADSHFLIPLTGAANHTPFSRHTSGFFGLQLQHFLVQLISVPA